MQCNSKCWFVEEPPKKWYLNAFAISGCNSSCESSSTVNRCSSLCAKIGYLAVFTNRLSVYREILLVPRRRSGRHRAVPALDGDSGGRIRRLRNDSLERGAGRMTTWLAGQEGGGRVGECSVGRSVGRAFELESEKTTAFVKQTSMEYRGKRDKECIANSRPLVCYCLL